MKKIICVIWAVALVLSLVVSASNTAFAAGEIDYNRFVFMDDQEAGAQYIIDLETLTCFGYGEFEYNGIEFYAIFTLDSENTNWEKLVEGANWNTYSCVKFRAPINNFRGCSIGYMIIPNDLAAAEQETWVMGVLGGGNGNINNDEILMHSFISVNFSAELPENDDNFLNRVDFVLSHPESNVDGIVIANANGLSGGFFFACSRYMSIYFDDIPSMFQFLTDVL